MSTSNLESRLVIDLEQLPGKPTLDDVRMEFAYRPFSYIDLRRATVLYEIQTGMAEWVLVIGHPEDGSYEWVVRTGGANGIRWARSNCCYGCSATALRDGLITALE